MADADREDEERHQQTKRIDAEAEQHQHAQLPDHGNHGAHHRNQSDPERLAVHPDGQQCQHQGDYREQDDRQRALGDIPHHLREADDLYVDVNAFELLANPRLELIRQPNRIDAFPVCVLFENDRAHQRAREIVRDQPSDNARFQDVLANLRKALRRGLEARGDHVARLDAVFHDLQVTHVRRVERLHPPTVDAVHHQYFVGRTLERLEEPRLEHVAVACRQADEHSIGAAEFRHLRREVGLHVLVLGGQLFGEGCIDVQPFHRHPHEGQREQHEDHDDGRAMPEDQMLELAGERAVASGADLHRAHFR